VGLGVLVFAMFINSASGAVSNCSWNSWMRDLVPQDRLGAFFSRRMQVSIAFGMVLSLIAGIYIDYWKKTFPNQELYGYSIIFFLGFAAGMIGVFYMVTIPEPQMSQTVQNGDFLEELVQPFMDNNFRNLILFLGPWNFAVNLAAPFFTVDMLQRLRMHMSAVVMLGVISQLLNMAFLRI
jgi:hypothetical protein